MPSNSVVLKDFMAKVPGAHLSIIAENSLYARVLLAFFCYMLSFHNTFAAYRPNMVPTV